MSSDMKDTEKQIDEVLTACYSTKPNGRAWCTRHLHSLDVGVCISCEASKRLSDLIKRETDKAHQEGYKKGYINAGIEAINGQD